MSTLWILALIGCPAPEETQNGVVVGNPGDAKLRWADLGHGPAERLTARVDRIDLVACDGPDVETVIVDAEVSLEDGLELQLEVGVWCHLELWFDGPVDVEDAQLNPQFVQVLAHDFSGFGVDEAGIELTLGHDDWADASALGDPLLWPLAADHLRLGSSVTLRGTGVTGAGTVYGDAPADPPEFVLAVGDAGSAWFSGDSGENWNPSLRALAGSFDHLAVAPGPGRAISLTAEGLALLTTDGSLAVQDDAPAGLTALTWSGDRFVAVGTDGLAAWSLDGLTWNTLDVGEEAALVAVAYHDGLGVAVAADGRVFTTGDGTGWTATADLAATVRDVVGGSGGFVAVGSGIWQSTDGASWTSVPEGAALELSAAVAREGGSVAVGDGVVVELADSVSIITDDIPALVDVTWSEPYLVGLGAGDALYQAGDIRTWTLRSGAPTEPIPLRAVTDAPVLAGF